MKLGRHKGMEVNCHQCGNLFVAVAKRVEQGLGKFCSKACFDLWQRENRKSNKWGKENAKTYQKASGGFFVQWYQDNGKPKNMPWHTWAWELAYGEIPDGHVVEYIDGDVNNITIDNLQLRMTRRKRQEIPKPPKVLTKEHREKLSKSLKLRWRRGDFTNTVFKDISGENNPGWRGGVRNLYSYEFRQICPFIRGRDNHKCQVCSKDLYKSKYGHVHHRDGNTENNNQDNLLLLCSTCHAKVHKSKGMESPPIMALRSELHWNR